MRRFFYRVVKSKKSVYSEHINGFPLTTGAWCNSKLKVTALNKIDKNAVSYIGIAYDEPKRFKVLSDTKISPLVMARWTEKMCYDWCSENNLLSPIYTSASRGGCWFCHNQGVDQLRLLRKSYPDYWKLLMKWDNDSPVTFKPDFRTVHDYDKRFEFEDKGYIQPGDRRFRWKCLDEDLQLPLKI